MDDHAHCHEGDQNGGYLHRHARDRLLSVTVFPSGHVFSWLGSRLPRDPVDHTIWRLSRGVTSGDRPVRGRTAGFRDTVQRAAHTAGMPVQLHHIVVDAHDLPGLARFWTQALGWKVLSERANEIVIGTDENAPVGMCFMPVTDPKTVKNRVHLDLTSSAADRDQEIDRLLALGARRAGIGQTGAESWTVLADPEGNEFCVVRPKETLI
jgi:predicted enzyme related to lactoylglutathione lyase